MKYHSGIIYTKLMALTNFLTISFCNLVFFANFALDFVNCITLKWSLTILQNKTVKRHQRLLKGHLWTWETQNPILWHARDDCYGYAISVSRGVHARVYSILGTLFRIRATYRVGINSNRQIGKANSQGLKMHDEQRWVPTFCIYVVL